MPSTHKIKARDLLEDIRSGLSDSELMEKFEMSLPALQSAFQQLIEARLITRKELRSRSESSSGDQPGDDTRRLPRNYLVIPLEIYDCNDAANKGVIRDLTEKGLGIFGIRSALDEVKRLIIPQSDLNAFAPVSFEARCRWTKKDEQGEYLSGFQIVSIEEQDLNTLRQLIEELSFGDS